VYNITLSHAAVNVRINIGVNNHKYPDDIQLYVEVAVADVHSALDRLRDCVSYIKD